MIVCFGDSFELWKDFSKALGFRICKVQVHASEERPKFSPSSCKDLLQWTEASRSPCSTDETFLNLQVT